MAPDFHKLFELGNYTAVAMYGSASDWRTFAAKGLAGKTSEAIAGLKNFSDPEARFYEAVAHWMAGDEQSSLALLESIQTEHAQRLLGLIKKPKIKVLSQLAKKIGNASDLLTEETIDGKFIVSNIGFADGDLQNSAYADIHTFYDRSSPPDFYFCGEIEWHLLPPNLGELPCPIFGRAADFDVHLQIIYPWLRVFDEIIANDHDPWEHLSKLASVPVSTFPKGYGLPDPLPALSRNNREIDIFISGTIMHPYHPDKAEHLLDVLSLQDPTRNLNICCLDGFMERSEYMKLLEHSKACFGYMRFPSGLVTRGLEALSMGMGIVIPEGNIITLYAGENDGVLTFNGQSQDLQKKLLTIVSNWETFEERAQRGAAIIRKEFSATTVISQILRFLTFLSAKPRGPRLSQSEQPHQKRGVYCRGYMFQEHIYGAILDRSLIRIGETIKQISKPHQIIDVARDAVMLHGAQIDTKVAKTLGSMPKLAGTMIASSFRLFTLGESYFPRSLVMRFNHIRSALHFGNMEEVRDAITLAHHTLQQPISSWELDPMEDVFPWDFYSQLFNYRKFFDRLTFHLESKSSLPVLRDELAPIILASLHYYLSFYESPLPHLQKAAELDPDFPFYKLHLAYQLIIRDQEEDLLAAGDILCALICKSCLVLIAFPVLSHIVHTGRYPADRAAPAINKLQFAFGRISPAKWGVEDWGEVPLRYFHLDTTYRLIFKS